MTWVVKRTDTFLESLNIFTPDKVEKIVYLNWIDHRKHAY